MRIQFGICLLRLFYLPLFIFGTVFEQQLFVCLLSSCLVIACKFFLDVEFICGRNYGQLRLPYSGFLYPWCSPPG